MPTLIDLLDYKEKYKLLLPGVQCGSIFKMKLTEAEGITPKNPDENFRFKYFIVLGMTKDNNIIGFVVVNSAINLNLSKAIKLLHYPISKTDYPFLDHDSYVHCGELKEIKTEVFINRYTSDTYGKLLDKDLTQVMNLLLSSPTETPKHLKKFGFKN